MELLSVHRLLDVVNMLKGKSKSLILVRAKFQEKFHHSPVVLSCCRVQGVCLPEAPPTTFWMVHTSKIVQIKKILSLLPPQWEKQQVSWQLFHSPKWGCLKLKLRILPYLDILHKLGVRVCTAPFRKVQAWPGAALTIKFMGVTTLGSRIVTKS